MVTEVVTLFSNMLDKYRRETDGDHMAVIFDASGAAAGLPGFAPRAPRLQSTKPVRDRNHQRLRHGPLTLS